MEIKSSFWLNVQHVWWIKRRTTLKKIIRLNRFQEPCNEKPLKNRAFDESSKSRGVFRTHANIYDRVFLWIFLSALFFRNISSIIDLRLGYIQASENIEIFKVKLGWSKSSRLLQHIAFLVKIEIRLIKVEHRFIWNFESCYF